MQDQEPISEDETGRDPVAEAMRLGGEHAADIAEYLNNAGVAGAAAILAHLPPERLPEIFDQPGLDCGAQLLAALPREQAGPLLTGMSVDRAAELLRQIAPPERAALLALADRDTGAALARVLAYPEGSAGSLMTTEFVSVPADWTVGQTLEHVRRVERTRETIYAIYVLDPRTGALLQAVTLRRLIAGAPDAPVVSMALERRPITIAPDADQEEAARLISKYDLLAVPVVDRGQIIGIVTVDDMIDTLVRESTEDAQKFGGMEAIDEPYMQTGFVQMIKKRGGWLSILFLSEMLTASAMQHFGDELQRALVLTLFIPLIMSSGGNSGSQATSLIIRSLALNELRLRDWHKVMLREIPMGVALGALLGLVGVARIALWQWMGLYDYGPHWSLVAATVFAALIGIVTFGAVAGSMLPFLLKRVGFDPASASAPFVATLVDVTGLVIYFSVALTILRGTLL